MMEAILSGDPQRAEAAVHEHIASGLYRELNALRDQRAAQESALRGTTTDGLPRWRVTRPGSRAASISRSQSSQTQ
jgi:hypothetical protein